MWLFIIDGFYSVVAHRHQPGRLLVRARVRADLERLQTRYPKLTRGKISDTFSADYPFRMTVWRANFASILADVVATMQHDNFKAAVAKVDPERAHQYAGVWSKLTEIGTCARCNLDTHYCPGCGRPATHDKPVCADCEVW